MGISLKLTHLLPEQLELNPAADSLALRSFCKRIQCEGLGDLPMVRATNDRYRVLEGSKRLKCILTLWGANALCFDSRHQRWARAKQVYRNIAVWMVHWEKEIVAGRVSQSDQELDLLTFVIVARRLRPPFDARVLARETLRLEVDLAEVFPFFQRSAGRITIHRACQRLQLPADRGLAI
jgi:hypothetical protein